MRRLHRATAAAVAALLITVPGALAQSPAASPAAEPTPAPAATIAPPPETPQPGSTGLIATIRERGQLICGVNGGLPGFSVLDAATGEYTGFDADVCRAIAAAVLGDATAVEFRPLSTGQRGPALQTGEIDVLVRNTTWTVSRDTSWGLFAPTTYYDGQAMMVRQDVPAAGLEDLAGASICVQSGTTTELNLTDQMRALGVDFEPIVFADIDPTYQAYEEGRCDAVTSDRSQLAARRTTMANPAEHVIMDVVMSKEPLGPVAPLGDDAWFNVVKWTVFALIEAEELGITAANLEEMRASENPVVKRLLGVEGELAVGLGLDNGWVGTVIAAVGNYGEIFDRNLGPNTPLALERGLNALWTEGGLLYAPPYR